MGPARTTRGRAGGAGLRLHRPHGRGQPHAPWRGWSTATRFASADTAAPGKGSCWAFAAGDQRRDRLLRRRDLAGLQTTVRSGDRGATADRTRHRDGEGDVSTGHGGGRHGVPPAAGGSPSWSHVRCSPCTGAAGRIRAAAASGGTGPPFAAAAAAVPVGYGVELPQAPPRLPETGTAAAPERTAAAYSRSAVQESASCGQCR